jgi:hypothetical protein
MTWTQALCDHCWVLREGEKPPHRLQPPDVERCALCGQDTTSGIYARLDPAKVPYPRKVGDGTPITPE